MIRCSTFEGFDDVFCNITSYSFINSSFEVSHAVNYFANSSNISTNSSTPLNYNDLDQQPPWLLAILIFIAILTVLGNGLIMLVFVCVRRLRTPFNYYIFNLALTDFLVGTIAMPGFTIYNMFNGVWPAGRLFCTFWMYFDWHMTFESTITLAAVSIDRYWSVRWPVSYKSHHSTRITVFILLATWVYMHITFFPGYLYDRLVNQYGDLECFWDLVLNERFSIPIAVLGYYLPLGAMIYCNVGIVQVMSKRVTAAAMKLHYQNGFNGKPQQGAEAQLLSKQKMAKERKPLITLSIITAAAVICWAPWVIYFTIAPHYPTALPDILVTIGYWMCYLNSTINPYLYIATSQEFRKACRQLLGCSRGRNSVVQPSMFATTKIGHDQVQVVVSANRIS